MDSIKSLCALLACTVVVHAFGNRQPYQVDQLSAQELQFLAQQRTDVDHWDGGAWTLWLDPQEVQNLEAHGINATAIENPSLAAWREWSQRPADAERDDFTYRNYAQLTAELQGHAADYPGICSLYSIGQSVQNRELWVMHIGDNMGVEENEPEFRFISTMHGDEVVGTVMLLNLIEDLLEGYGSDSRLTNIVNEIDLHILVLMNPDGMNAGQRYNANGVDLNRDFPDRITDPVNTSAGRAPETAAVMQWTADHHFVLSMNYHGGAVVSNYGYDGNVSGSSVYTAAPDDALFIDLAHTYANQNTPMLNSFTFADGITNGADWYVIYGGMQDWSYVWEGDIDLTLEVSQIKWAPENLLAGYWQDNRESMLQYLEYSLRGIRGRVTDAISGDPLAATIKISGVDSEVYSDSIVGDFHRLALAGTYTIEVSAEGYESAVVPNISVSLGDATIVDVPLNFVGLPQIIIEDDFSSTGAWQLQPQWQIGSATSGGGEHGPADPALDTSAGADNGILGYAIGADYDDNIPQTLWATSPVYNLEVASQCQLKFQRLLGLERNQFDHGYIQVWNGSSWQPLWENSSATITDAGWNEQVFDISSWADGRADFQLRFGLGSTDTAWRYCGWNIDDLQILGILESTQPETPQLSISISGTTVILSWPAATNATQYRIESRNTLDLPWAEIATQSDLQISLPLETTMTNIRSYRVIALNN